MRLSNSNKFYANMKLGVLTSTPQQGYKPIKTTLSYIDAMNYLAYYQEDGKSFEEAVELIERL